MSDVSTLIYALTSLAGLAFTSVIGLVAFGKWVELKRAEIDALRMTTGHMGDGTPHTANRIELADRKERLRKLEPIAAGVDL